MARRKRQWFGIVALCSVTAIGCATGGIADPDADVKFEEDVKKPTEDTGEKPTEDTGEGEDAVVGGDVGGELDSGAPTDTGEVDAGTMDAGVTDTGPMDSGPVDSGPVDTGPMDTGPMDTGPRDTGPIDTGPRDTGPVDTGPVDTGPVDTGPVDTGPVDAGRTIMCPSFPFSTRTCRGDDACCLSVGGLAAGCGVLVPVFGCLPN
nr:hypothetical protein [Deltaproteobacteria bacterium]